MSALLTVRRVVVEPASREVLQARLDERLRDLKFREERGGGNALATGWLREEIAVLERALSLGVQEPVGINGLTEAETSATASVMGIVGVPAPAPQPLPHQTPSAQPQPSDQQKGGA